MEEQQALARWKKFHVYQAGNTKGAHLPIARFLSTIGQTEVNAPEECDYLLVFCPVVSRVGTDIGEALSSIPLRRPVILVVMHHTFNRQHVVAESWRQVDNPNVCLTVDCLFYEGQLLNCNLNDIMWANIRTFFRVPTVSNWNDWIIQRRKPVLIGVTVAVLILIVLIICFWSIQSAPGNNTHHNK